MPEQIKKHLKILLIGVILTAAFLFIEECVPPFKLIHFKIYDILNQVERRLKKPPKDINDIVIVGIDDRTAGKMTHRWPYPRTVFANVIRNITAAKPKVLAFDFVFLGKSEDAEDQELRAAIENNNRIILASTIDENGSLNIHSLPSLSANVPSGIVTKLQDADGVIRRSLTYLISDEVPPKGFLSWELTIMKRVEGLHLTPVKGNESFISVQNDRGEKWAIPVDWYTKSFIINFRARPEGFKRVSFYDAYTGNFDPAVFTDKIVLVGFTSSLLGDIHNTPIGWMPGIVLNANALLTISSRRFISNSPVGIYKFLTIVGVLLSIMAILLLDIRTAYILIAAEIVIFFIASYVLLSLQYTWDYFAFPLTVAVVPLLSRKIYTWIWQRKKFYWT